jgi:hypothetical protein
MGYRPNMSIVSSINHYNRLQYHGTVTPFSSEVQERVELYISVPSWQVIGSTYTTLNVSMYKYFFLQLQNIKKYRQTYE